MSLTTTSDSELLVQFRNPITKEKAYTYHKKIPGKIILAYAPHGGRA